MNNKAKIVQGLSDALGIAGKIDRGAPLRIYHATEFFLDGIRLNAGTYEIRKVPDNGNVPNHNL
jgi:hypothetical protein